jgi:hypothetical protein
MGLIGVGCAADSTGPQAPGTYAESVYATYEQAAGGRIAFTVETVHSGALQEIGERSFADLLGVPEDWIIFHVSGVEIDQLASGPRNRAIDEWSVSPPSLKGAEEAGFPIAEGTYRLLRVGVNLDGTSSQHNALEVCWAALGHCAVADPVVDKIDSFYRNYLRLKDVAAVKNVAVVETDQLRSLTCASAWWAHNQGGKATSFTRTWSSYTWHWYNIFGGVVGWVQLGTQQQGFGCHVVSGVCKAYTFGQSDAGSCYAGFLNSCAQDHQYHAAASGDQMRVGAQADGVFASPSTGSSCNIGISGSGVSFGFTLSISSGNQVSLGGVLSDTCLWM